MSLDIFRGSPEPTLGVEVELQLLDSRSMALASAIDTVLAEVPTKYKEMIKPEFYQSCVEINTDVCRSVAQVGTDLVPKLTLAARVAGRHGLLLGWGGTHPFSRWHDQPITSSPRYQQLASLYRDTLSRQLTFGLHVHVGVPDGNAAVKVCNRITEHLPPLLALSVNSPFWCGRATGLHSHRVEVMGASPTGSRPPRLSGWDAYVELVHRLTETGVIDTPNDLWWNVRPSPRHGTVEIRVCDMPPDLRSVLGLTALIQCLVVTIVQEDAPDMCMNDCELMIVQQNHWRAARFGLEAEFVDPRSGVRTRARDVCAGLTERLRPIANELGCAPQLELARAMADCKTGSEKQLAEYAWSRSFAEVVWRRLVRPAGFLTAPAELGMLAGDGLKAATRADGPWPSLLASR